MADHEYHGNQGVILADPGMLTTKIDGLATCTAMFSTTATNYGALPDVNAFHPIFTFMQMEERELSLKGQFAIASCKYAGIQFDFMPPTYELKVGLSDEPIETHPEFVNKIGGTPKQPLNGAVFRKIGKDGATLRTAYDGYPDTDTKNYVFKEFQLFINGKLNPFAKVESYLESSCLTWSKTVNRRTPVSDIQQVGKIDNPQGPAPNLSTGRNWLFMGITQTRRGSAYQSVTEWRASGRRGWLQPIYE